MNEYINWRLDDRQSECYAKMSDGRILAYDAMESISHQYSSYDPALFVRIPGYGTVWGIDGVLQTQVSPWSYGYFYRKAK